METPDYHHDDDDDLGAAEANHGIPAGWIREVNAACTIWLETRGLLVSQLDPHFAAARTAGQATRRKMTAPAAHLP